MKVWEFCVSVQKDVGVLADLLEDLAHPGAQICRDLANDRKFPVVSTRQIYNTETSKWETKTIGYRWMVRRYTTNVKHPVPHSLPNGTILNPDKTYCYYYTITEAIWAVINAGKYVSTKRAKK